VNLCRACKAPIRWARTETGKSMPLDALPAADGTIAIVDGVAIVLEATVRARLHETELEVRPLYRSHFATCPYAVEFRGPE
jgi:hypothetical protein